MRVLIAEDSLTQAVDLRRRLESLGHEVTVANNGRQAWELLQSKPVPVAILDWLMPQMNGVDLCRKIRSEKTLPYVYLILLTSKDHRHERLQGLRSGADEFLSKPIDTNELEVSLKTAGASSPPRTPSRHGYESWSRPTSNWRAWSFRMS